MKKFVTLMAAGALALSSAAFAQSPTPAKAAAPAAAAAAAKLDKPAGIAQDAWDKMSDADKKAAIDKAKMAAPKAADKPKKEKKGGC